VIGDELRNLIWEARPEKVERDGRGAAVGGREFAVAPGLGWLFPAAQMKEEAVVDFVHAEVRQVAPLLAEKSDDFEPGQAGLFGCLAQGAIPWVLAVLQRSGRDLDSGLRAVGVREDEEPIRVGDVGEDLTFEDRHSFPIPPAP
jgi:hypothetical protein